MTSTHEGRVAALPAELRERLRQRLAGNGERATGSDIGAADRTAPLPLSFAQQRLWFADQLQPGSAEYHSALPLRLRGPLDAPALAGALRQLVARHEILRTTFVGNDGTPVQVPHPAGELALPMVDLSGRPDELDAVLTREYERPFDLTAAPPIRAL